MRVTIHKEYDVSGCKNCPFNKLLDDGKFSWRECEHNSVHEPLPIDEYHLSGGAPFLCPIGLATESKELYEEREKKKVSKILGKPLIVYTYSRNINLNSRVAEDD